MDLLVLIGVILFQHGMLYYLMQVRNSRLRRQTEACDFCLCLGLPFGSRLRDGPLVMNTKEKLNLVFKDWDENKFIKN